MKTITRLFDWPPVWLLIAMYTVWALDHLFARLSLHFPGQGPIGLGLIGAGIVMTLLAALEMRRARTTLVPRRDPNALVTTGIFRFTRNPIYLSDWIILLGWIVFWGSILGLPLLWLFPKVIVKRFITGEEAKMRAHFGDRFEDWARRTRRWI